MKIRNEFIFDKLIRITKKLKIHNKYDKSALNIKNKELINSFTEQVDFPWFISFPRTGSHWIRMLMELYFEKPSLVEIYYYKDAKSFTCFHQHDIQLEISGCKNVLYLFRDPVDTIYSQISYEKLDLNDVESIYRWADIYGKHLSKWLIEEKFTIKKTIISYEGMQNNLHNEFKKICQHFNERFDGEKLDVVFNKVTKEDLKKRTLHDAQVVNLSKKYNENRKIFRNKYAGEIINIIKGNNFGLENYFSFDE